MPLLPSHVKHPSRINRVAVMVGRALSLGMLSVGVLSVGVVSAPVAATPSSPAPSTTTPEPTDPIDRIVAARKKANERAEEVFAVESDVDALEIEIDQLEDKVDALQAQIDALEDAAAAVAIDAFVGSSTKVIPVLTDDRAPIDRSSREILLRLVNSDLDADVDDLDVLVGRLEDAQADLAEAKREAEAEHDKVEELLSDALAEVDKVRELEAEFLNTDAERQAVKARWIAENRSESRQEAEAVLAAENTLVPTGPNGPTEYGMEEGAPAADASGNLRGGRTSNGAVVAGRTGEGGYGSDGELPPPPDPVIRPATPYPTTVPANPDDPAAEQPAQPAVPAVIPGFMCPMGGFSSYADTWGAPRSGGRSHEGVDMIAHSGTPLLAVVSGVVVRRTTPLGGTSLDLYGDDGHRYYYAHLSQYGAAPGWVEQGAVVGYVGDTGNATGTPHLHFEIHPFNGSPVNPYATVVAAGC